MGYKVIDFRSIVTLWYNEFLPERVGDKSVFVDEADIIYLKPISLESIRNDTIGFIMSKARELSGSDIALVVQEPKPVNNVRIRPILRFIERLKGMSIDRRDKVLHFANRRYVPLSSNVMVSQDKEIDNYLEGVFGELSEMDSQKMKMYPIQSLGISDFIESAKSFFPRKDLSFQEDVDGKYISVRSTNDIIDQLRSFSELDVNASDSDEETRYIERCRLSMLRDMEILVR